MHQRAARFAGGLVSASALVLSLAATVPAGASAVQHARAVPSIDILTATRPIHCTRGAGGTAFVKLYLKANGHPVAMKTGFTLGQRTTGDSPWVVSITGGRDYGYEYHGIVPSGVKTWSGKHNSQENPPHGHYAGLAGNNQLDAAGGPCHIVGTLSAHGHL